MRSVINTKTSVNSIPVDLCHSGWSCTSSFSNHLWYPSLMLLVFLEQSYMLLYAITLVINLIYWKKENHSIILSYFLSSLQALTDFKLEQYVKLSKTNLINYSHLTERISSCVGLPVMAMRGLTVQPNLLSLCQSAKWKLQQTNLFVTFHSSVWKIGRIFGTVVRVTSFKRQ